MLEKLLDGVTAVNSPPSGNTAGKEIKGSFSRGKPSDEYVIVAHSTAGSGTMTVTLKLWGYVKATSKWYPLGTDATAADKGKLNDGNAIAETQADSIEHAEVVIGIRHFDRVYLEVTAIGGTSTAIDAYIMNRN
jgi:hypothetical protein